MAQEKLKKEVTPKQWATKSEKWGSRRRRGKAKLDITAIVAVAAAQDGHLWTPRPSPWKPHKPPSPCLVLASASRPLLQTQPWQPAQIHRRPTHLACRCIVHVNIGAEKFDILIKSVKNILKCEHFLKCEQFPKRRLVLKFVNIFHIEKHVWNYWTFLKLANFFNIRKHFLKVHGFFFISAKFVELCYNFFEFINFF